MSVIVDLGVSYTQFVGISVIYLRTKFHMPSFSSSVVIAIKPVLKKFANGRDVLQLKKELSRQTGYHSNVHFST